jgi:predicted phage terminase large subunit-like protein
MLALLLLGARVYPLPVPPKKPGIKVPTLQDLLLNRKEAQKRLNDLSLEQFAEFVSQVQSTLRGLGGVRNLPASPANFALKYSRSQWKIAPHLQYLSDKLVQLEQRKIKRLLVSVPPRHGKQCSHDTLVPTSNGFKRHGDLQVGDLVLGRDGRAYPVLALGSESGENDIRLTFSDGSSVVCHENHEWVVYDRSARRERIHETKVFFRRKLEAGPDSGRGHRYQIHLPAVEPVWGPHRDLPLDPYVLGAWLGDGTSVSGCITHHDVDRHVIERCAQHFRVGSVLVNKVYPRTGFIGLQPKLKRMGLLRNKHIPQQYLSASESQRRELLAGLIDTDGAVGCDGRVRFSNTNPQLVEDVRTLACSLGYRAGIVEVEPTLSSSGIQGKKKVYQVCFTPHDQEAASMPRKRHGVFGTRRRLALIKAERVPPEKGRCIQTAAPDGVYLITKSFIPTHNSFLIDQFFPAWWLSKHPKDRIVLVGYGEQFAREWGAKVRDLILDYSEELNLLVNKDRTAADDWTLTAGGGMLCVGVGGSLMGKGADLLLFDDVIKTSEEANSTLQRDKIWEWFQSTAMTRLQPNAVVVGVQTRWHQDDLFGRIIANLTDWEVINIPAIAVDKDPLGRAPGTPLWPEFWGDPDYYAKVEKSTHPAIWSALYQGQPVTAGGGDIKGEWFRFWSVLPEFEQMIQSWDLSLKDKETSDYSVGQVWGRRQGSLYLIDSVRGHYNLQQVCNLMRQFTLKYPKAIGKLVEDAAMGPFVKQTLHHEVPGIIPIIPKGSKRSRVQAIVPLLMAGNVYLPERQDGTKDRWVWNLVTECEAFPKGANDDQVDALSQALGFLTPGLYSEALRLEREKELPEATPDEARREWFKQFTTKTLKDADRKYSTKSSRIGLNRLLRQGRIW